ncbi:MAG: nitrous oxide reductase accessory protein NosL [Thermodesulfovibrionales bacterium]
MLFRALLLLAACLLLTTGAHADGPKPVEITKTDKCPVCGMFVAKYRNWISQVVFSDGTYAAFDGPKDMFKYYFNLQKYNPSKRLSDIRAVYVIEYYSAKPVDARTAWFVLGSDVYGPMGAEFIPVSTEAQAKEFLKDHKGKKIVTFRQITPDLIP